MASLDFELEKKAFREYYDAEQRFLLDAEVFFRSLVGALLSDMPNINPPTLIGRVKDREEAIKKFSLKYQSDLESRQINYEIKDHITDLIGIRVISLYEDEIDTIAATLKKNFDVLSVTNKIEEIESTESNFGYKGLHMDLRINDLRRKLPEYARFGDLRFELQIRTITQDAWSVLDHKIKYKKSIPATLKRRINVLAAQFELVDREFLAIRNASRELEQAQPGGSPTNDSKELDAFAFLAIVKPFFAGYVFSPENVDGFVQEILRWKPSFTSADLNEAIVGFRGKVEQYRNQSTHNMNPFTVLRHILFISNRTAFNLILFDLQRNNFEQWERQAAPS